jgi:hypothetical protein
MIGNKRGLNVKENGVSEIGVRRGICSFHIDALKNSATY